MGTTAHVVVTDGSVSELDYAERRIEQLEARWSRFRDTSEISGLNRAGGRPRTVSHDTVRLLDRCVRAWRRTAGAFDPTVHDAMVEHGYDRDFADMSAEAKGPLVARPAPGLHGLVIDVERRLVALPASVRIDPGGIGKGLAADFVCSELRARGSVGVCVNLGGDLRVAGHAPEADHWSITIHDPFDDARELMRIGITEGAVATSSRVRRTWRRDGQHVHHVIDPRTGSPAEIHTAAVTAIARSAWWAEVSATSSLLALDPLSAADSASVVAVDEDGSVRATQDLKEVLSCSAH